MSEIKRVALNTLETQKENAKVIKKTCKTVRISVILPESNEDNCPEYNYKDQLAAIKRKNKHSKDLEQNSLDPYGVDDDDVLRIALEMEAKYGSGITGKKKRKGRKDDYADIGMGYDESDSFIDNTDGYDEIIPQNVTTLHGGFYINCGALEFKTDEEASTEISSNSSDSDGEKKKSNHRKRILETSDDSDSDTTQNENETHTQKKPKVQSDKNSMQQAIKKKLFSQNKIQIKKRRPIDPLKKTVKELLREKREDLNMTIPSELEKEEHLEKEALKENKKPMSITSVTDAIESVVKQVVEEAFDSSSIQIVDIDNLAESAASKCSSEPPFTIEGESSQDQSEKRELVKLPENIPPDISEIVNKIKQAALDYRDEGKKKFFSDEVNFFLLSLEKKCKILGKSSRLRVYDYLSFFCKVRKETLIRRARNLILEEEENKQRLAMNKLKDCVTSALPTLIANFEQENQKVLAMKFSAESQNEENKNLKLPRKRFHWTEETKKLLKDIMNAKKKCLILEGKQKDNLEELMVTFLRNSILPIWPDGWMYLNNLKKVFNSMTDSSKVNTPNKSNVVKSNIGSGIDKSNIDKPNTDKSNGSSCLDSVTPKHSNLTITPVEIQSTTIKSEVSNSVTVTKITNDVSTNNHKVSETTMSSPHLLKKMFDEIVKPKSDDTKNSSYSSQERSNPDKDNSRSKIINLDVSSTERHNQELFKSQTERNLIVEQKNHWPSEVYGTNKEQSVPADYSSKHSKSLEDKVEIIKHLNTSKSLWSTNEPEPVKYSRHNEVSSSFRQSSKHLKSNENPKLISLSVNDLLMKPDNLSDNSIQHSDDTKHHTNNSIHNTDSTKHFSDSKHCSDSTVKHSDITKHYSDSSSKHKSDNTKHYSNSTKQYYDETKHNSDVSKFHSDSFKQQSDNSKHQSDSFKHTKVSETIKLPSDNNVIVLNAQHSKESDSKSGHKEKLKDNSKSGVNAVVPKSANCQLMDLSDGKNKSKIEDNKSYSKYSSSSSSKDLLKSEIKVTTKPAEVILTNSSNYYSDPMKLSQKYTDFSSGISFLSSTPNKLPKSEGDSDIQMVMENLKALQKLSRSPVKNDSTSSPVSVIAFNKNFSGTKSTSSNQGSVQRTCDANATKTADFTGAFQDDFQKQFINSIQMSANPSTTKSNYGCS